MTPLNSVCENFYSTISQCTMDIFELLDVQLHFTTNPIEKSVLGLKKDNLVMEADGSAYQSYKHERGVIDVSNDCYIGALYVDADFDLRPYFQHIV